MNTSLRLVRAVIHWAVQLRGFFVLACQRQNPNSSRSLVESVVQREKTNTLLLVLLFCGWAGPIHAGILYTNAELWAAGNLWKQTKCEWDAEVARHQARISEIKDGRMKQSDKDFLLQQEVGHHRSASKKLAQQRARVHNVLLDEANARVAGGRTAASERAHATLGTSVNDPAHRGMRGDLDAQAGPRTIAKIEDTLKDMGLEDLLPPPNQRRPGTLEIGGEFEMTIHQSGVQPKAGDSFYHTKVNTDARNPESYLSAGMKDPVFGTKQAGTDYVEVQDHLKKAQKGHFSSGDELINSPDKLQSMAKGTNKVLDMGNVNDDELGIILKQRGIKDSPAEFKKKLAGLKQERLMLTDPAEAAMVRGASEDIFNLAEQKAVRKSKQEFKAKKESLTKIKEDIQKAKEIQKNAKSDHAKQRRANEVIEQKKKRYAATQEELLDSKTRMNAAKAANEEVRNAAKGRTDPTADKPRKVAPDTGSPGGANRKGSKVFDRLKGPAAKGVEGFGVLMDIAEIGNACRLFQEYREGKAEAGEVLRAAVDMTPMLGDVVGIAEKAGTSAFDYIGARKEINKANQVYMEAYLVAWENQFRKAGMKKADARKYIANAVLAGNLDVLEAKADLLQATTGREIDRPQLTIEELPGPDGGAYYMWENTKDLAVGMLGIAENAKYILVGATADLLSSSGERELIEAQLEYDAVTAEADMRTRLFRAFLNAGIDREQALAAVNDGGAKLKTVRNQARENIAEIKRLQEEEEAARQELIKRIHSVHGRINKLRFRNLALKTAPASPISISRDTPDDSTIEVTVEIGGEFDNLLEMVQFELGQIAEVPAQIDVNYAINLKHAEVVEPGVWKIELPAKQSQYPVTVQAVIVISGLSGELAPLSRVIRREINGSVLVQLADESIQLTEEAYTFLDGDYEQITANVTGQNEDSEYVYLWTIDGEEQLIEEPHLWFAADLKDPEKARTSSVKVQLYEANKGMLLDESSAAITISPGTGKVIATDALGGWEPEVYEIFTCSEVRTSGEGLPKILDQDDRDIRYSDAITSDEEITQAWVTADRYLGQKPGSGDSTLYGLPHGRYKCYISPIARDLAMKKAKKKLPRIIWETGTYKNGFKHGKWTEYVTDPSSPFGYGNVQRVIHYVKGKKHGVEIKNKYGNLYGWRGKQQTKTVTNWKNGVKHGREVIYHEKIPGGISLDHMYQNGNLISGFSWRRVPHVIDRDIDLNIIYSGPKYHKTVFGHKQNTRYTYDENFSLMDTKVHKKSY